MIETPAQTPALDSTEAAGLIQDLLQSVYRQAYLTVAEQAKLPMPPHTVDLLGNPDDFLQKIIPPDNPEAEAKRRRRQSERRRVTNYLDRRADFLDEQFFRVLPRIDRHSDNKKKTAD